MYASQKVSSKVSDESQTTLDTYICSGQENHYPNQEFKKTHHSSKQQISIDSFLAKKSLTNHVDIERGENQSLETPRMAASANLSTSKISNPYLTYEIKSAMTHTSPSTPINLEDCNSSIESSMRVESKSSPFPLDGSAPTPPASFQTKTGELSPKTIAKIEENRLKALARRNQILGRQEFSHSSPSPSLPSSIQQRTYSQTPHINLNTSHGPQSRPTRELQTSYQFVPPSPTNILNPSPMGFPNFPSAPTSRTPCMTPSSGHVFSTGSGNSLRISQEALENANTFIISNPTIPNPMKKTTRSVD